MPKAPNRTTQAELRNLFGRIARRVGRVDGTGIADLLCSATRLNFQFFGVTFGEFRQDFHLYS